MKRLALLAILLGLGTAPGEAQDVPGTEWRHVSVRAPGNPPGSGQEMAWGTNPDGSMLQFSCGYGTIEAVGLGVVASLPIPGLGDSARVTVQIDSNDPHPEVAWVGMVLGSGPNNVVGPPSDMRGEYTVAIAREALSATERIVVRVEAGTSAEPETTTYVFSPAGLRSASAQLPCMSGSGEEPSRPE